MGSRQWRSRSRWRVACLVGVLLLSGGTQARAQQSLHAVGVPQIGPNNDCGVQVWALSGVAPGADSFARPEPASGATYPQRERIETPATPGAP